MWDPVGRIVGMRQMVCKMANWARPRSTSQRSSCRHNWSSRLWNLKRDWKDGHWIWNRKLWNLDFRLPPTSTFIFDFYTDIHQSMKHPNEVQPQKCLVSMVLGIWVGKRHLLYYFDHTVPVRFSRSEQNEPNDCNKLLLCQSFPCGSCT